MLTSVGACLPTQTHTLCRKQSHINMQMHNATSHKYTERMTKQNFLAVTNLHEEEEHQNDKDADIRVQPGSRAAQTDRWRRP